MPMIWNAKGPTEDNHCTQCNKIRALPWSPTRRDMTLDHLLDLGHQARPGEAPRLAKLIEAARIMGRLYNLPGLLNACDEAESGEPAELGRIDTGLIETLNRTIDELRADRAKWVRVCDERDKSIIKLRDDRDTYKRVAEQTFAEFWAMKQERDALKDSLNYLTRDTAPCAPK